MAFASFNGLDSLFLLCVIKKSCIHDLIQEKFLARVAGMGATPGKMSLCQWHAKIVPLLQLLAPSTKHFLQNDHANWGILLWLAGTFCISLPTELVAKKCYHSKFEILICCI